MQANWLHFWCFPPRLLWALPIVMTVCLSLPSLRSLAPRRRPPPKRHCPAIVGVRPISGTKSDAGGDGSRRGGQYAVQLTSNSRTPSAAVNVDLHARLSVLPKDRAKDMQAEARALSRATNATAYHPEVLAAKFSSRPFKVSPWLEGSSSSPVRLISVVFGGRWSRGCWRSSRGWDPSR